MLGEHLFFCELLPPEAVARRSPNKSGWKKMAGKFSGKMFPGQFSRPGFFWPDVFPTRFFLAVFFPASFVSCWGKIWPEISGRNIFWPDMLAGRTLFREGGKAGKLAPRFHPSFLKTFLLTKIVAARAIEILAAANVVKISRGCRF